MDWLVSNSTKCPEMRFTGYNIFRKIRYEMKRHVIGHHDILTQYADIVPWEMVVYVCVCVFPTELSKVLSRLYVFRPPLFLCNVKCSGLTGTLSLGTPCHAQQFPFLLRFLSYTFCPLCLLAFLYFFALLPLFLCTCTFGCMHAYMSVFSMSRPKLCCSCITCRGTEMFI